MLVIEVDTSIRIGSPDVGSPAAIGFGVMKGLRPPCGATATTVGSELSTTATSPASVARLRYAARHAMWCERLMTMLPVPQTRAIAVARSSARSVSQGPGRRLPSQLSAAGRRLSTSGSPDLAI